MMTRLVGGDWTATPPAAVASHVTPSAKAPGSTGGSSPTNDHIGAEPATAPSTDEGYFSLIHVDSMPPYDPPKVITGASGVPISSLMSRMSVA